MGGERCAIGRVRCVIANLQAATVYRIDAHLFHHSLNFSFFSLPFLDLDASFHRFRFSIVPVSLLDATRLLG